jgi:PAS domain S-box-containing protein
LISSPDVREWIQEQLFDEVPVAICVIDREFNIVRSNRRFEEMYGETAGRPCYEVYKGRSGPCVNCGALRTFEDGQMRRREERGQQDADRPRWYVVDDVPIVAPDGSIPYVVEMSTDISHVKELEQQKLEAERLAAVGQTVAGLAHGIKNIIMGLEGGMYVVNSGLQRNDTDRLLTGWKMLQEEITRISSFAKEFLDFAKGRQPHVEVIDPNDVARQVTELFLDRGRASGIELVADLDEGIQPAAFERDGLHLCLTNLVSNAIDACEMSERRGTHVIIRSLEEDGEITFEVLDDGCGMDYDVKRKVFTNFFSTKASGKGTGLGLLATRKVVQQHGGSVWFDSVEGRGSVFRLEFPRSRLPEPVAVDQEEQGSGELPEKEATHGESPG